MYTKCTKNQYVKLDSQYQDCDGMSSMAPRYASALELFGKMPDVY